MQGIHAASHGKRTLKKGYWVAFGWLSPRTKVHDPFEYVEVVQMVREQLISDGITVFDIGHADLVYFDDYDDALATYMRYHQ